MTHPRPGLLVATALTLLACAASAQDTQTLHHRALAATCANCHGSDGKAPQGSSLASLAGMPANVFTERMKAFQATSSGPTVMHQIAKGFSDVQIEQMAVFFASQKRL
jgi:cytochrome subunit of sulfide dehydrogenase